MAMSASAVRALGRRLIDILRAQAIVGVVVSRRYTSFT